MKFFALKMALFLNAWLVAAPASQAMPKTVVVIRHAEKPADESNIHLSEKGYARAAKLPQFFLRFDSASSIRLIAQGQKRADSSLRPIETVMPASQQFQQPILHQFVKGESLSSLLGAPQGEWSSKIFDRAWVFRFNEDGECVRFEDVAQELKL
jgi:hypothetical protein